MEIHFKDEPLPSLSSPVYPVHPNRQDACIHEPLTSCTPRHPSLRPQRQLTISGTDPFSRTELTMERVKPNDELRERIRAFMAERGADPKRGPAR